MSVEAAIYEAWRAYRPLSDLVPVESVWKGRLPQKGEDDSALVKPYVSLMTEDPESTRTSSNVFTMANLQLRVYAETEAEAERIVNEAKDYLDGLSGNWSRGRVLDCKWNGTTREDDEDDGSWNLVATFAVQVEEARRPALLRHG